VSVNEPRYWNFHHDMAPGKVGLLAMMDGISTAGAPHIETILAELNTAGEVMREWDLTDIFRQEMTAAGDDPTNFVRDGVDWFHMNSAVYLPEDDSLLVSSRENFVVKLDYASGTIKWVFGDPTKHWYVNYPSLRRLAVTLPAGLYPIGQHAVSSPAAGELLLFNNGRASNNNPAGRHSNELFCEGFRQPSLQHQPIEFYGKSVPARVAEEGRELEVESCRAVWQQSDKFGRAPVGHCVGDEVLVGLCLIGA